MRKHFLGVAALAVASALTLAACSSGSPAEETTGGGDGGGGESTTVTVWMYPVISDEAASQEYWTGVEEGFEAENSDIDLQIDLQPWDNRDEKIATAIASGTGPDLVLLGSDQALNYFTIGGLKPVTDLIENKDAYLPGPIDSVTFDGDVYGIPFYQTSTTTVYNKTLFDEAGITELPTTWDEILTAAPALAANDVAIMDYSGSPEMTLNLSFYPLLWQAGGSVFTEDGTDIAFDGPGGIKALEFLMELQAMGGLSVDAATKGNAVEGGPLGNGTTAMGYALTRSEVDMMVAAHGEEAVVVGAPLTDVEQATFGTPGVLSLTTINEDQEAAAAAANYIASPEVAHELNVLAGSYPVRSDTEAPAEDEATLAFVDALEVARPGAVVPNARQVMAVLAPHLQAALLGDKTAEQALTDAAAEARALLK